MTDMGKSCMMCKRFGLSLGERGYSEFTPGGIGRIECRANEQPDLNDEDASEVDFREWVRFGNKCPRFEGAE